MPIPQLKQNKGRQSWRTQKKKYYVSRKSGSKYSFKYPKKKSSGFNNRRNKKFSFKRLILNKKLIKFFSLALLIFLIIGFVSVAWISRGLPDPNKLIDRQIAQSTKIYDRTGETVLYDIYGAEQRTIVSLDEIPEYAKWATIAIEDKDFYKHKGISIWGILRGVVWQKLKGQRAQGGSTLTQQFIKNAILTSDRKISRKIKEWILAQKLEKKYSKEEILQMYFNEIPYGSTAYGIEAASQRYFGKSVKNINIAEAAVLAALPQAPSRYSPYGSNKDILIQRQHYIIDLMYKQGYIPEHKAEAAKLYKLEFKKQSTNIIAPHFVMYVKEILSEKYGEKMIEQEGLKIYTTLDLYKQEIAERVIEGGAEKNEKNYEATNAALIAIDPKTGQILTMVGSRDYFNEDIDGQVNIVTSQRQPGSSMKPIVYASAFEKGYTPDTILYDVVTNFSHDPAEPYEPHNYDSQEHGPVTIKKALAGSLNIPAVKAIYLAGIENVLDLAENFGYTTFTDRERFGLSLVLGGGEVKLLEHTNAYSVFARDGDIHPITAILKIEDKNGKIIEEFDNEKKGKKILDSNIARMINNILSDNNARAYAFGEQNWLTLGGRPVGAKTGTTNDYRDAWAIGYTPSIVAGVWVGNNDNTQMKRGAAGGTVAAPIWHDFMKEVLGNTPIESFKEPKISETGKPVLDGKIDAGETIKIDTASGLLATENTPADYIKEIIYKQDHCILYYLNKDDPLADAPKNPSKDPQFELWESRVIKWSDEQGATTSVEIIIPTEYDNIHTLENQPVFKILSPTNNQTITEPFITSNLEASAPRGINRAEYYINDNLITTNNSYPFNLEKQIDFLNNGFHNLKVRVCDDIDNCSEQSVEFNLILDKEPDNSEINISWLEPSNGLAVNSIDFPLNIKLQASNYAQIAKVNIYLIAEDKENLVAILQPIENEIIAGEWKKPPASGTYELIAEANGWGKQIKKSQKITITITNE